MPSRLSYLQTEKNISGLDRTDYRGILYHWKFVDQSTVANDKSASYVSEPLKPNKTH
jgi:hypothetical protein